MLISAMLILLFAVSCSKAQSEAGQPEPVHVKDAEVVRETPGDSDAEDTGYPPEGWVTDITEAYRLAQADGKNILVNFTGSDWCVWCKKLSEEVFSTDEFMQYAEENLVLLFLDSPQSISLPAEQVQHNQIMGQMLGVQGYPTIWLLGSDLSPLLSTGYRAGGAGQYIEHLENDRPEIEESDREDFRTGFTEAIEANIGPLQ